MAIGARVRIPQRDVVVPVPGLWLAVLGGIEGQGPPELAGVAGYDPDVEVGDQGEDGCSGAPAADADVVEPAVAQRMVMTPVGSILSARMRWWAAAAGLAAGRAATTPVRASDLWS
jgi:hypothetical protein